MSSAGTITTWKGKPLESYSKEELIDIVRQIGQLYHEHLKASIHAMEVMRMFRDSP